MGNLDDVKEKKRRRDAESGDESPEEGECSESGDSGGDDEIDNLSPQAQESSVAWPPCMRIIVKETNLPAVKPGTLFIVTYTGGTLGREGDHAVIIPDINISRSHAKFTFNASESKYFITDFGSRNGTFLNGKRLSVAKRESELHEVVHGSWLKVGGTKLLCHIHIGGETCGHCEPGLVQQLQSTTSAEKKIYSSKSQHKKELQRLRRKFGLEKCDSQLPAPSVLSNYEDRAQIRRETVGSQNPHEKTQATSEDEPISSENKGFQLMTKMGWTRGEALGKAGKGLVEPITVSTSPGKCGLGADPPPPAADPSISRKNDIWRKVQERYQQL